MCSQTPTGTAESPLLALIRNQLRRCLYRKSAKCHSVRDSGRDCYVRRAAWVCLLESFVEMCMNLWGGRDKAVNPGSKDV